SSRSNAASTSSRSMPPPQHRGHARRNRNSRGAAVARPEQIQVLLAAEPENRQAETVAGGEAVQVVRGPRPGDVVQGAAGLVQQEQAGPVLVLVREQPGDPPRSLADPHGELLPA